MQKIFTFIFSRKIFLLLAVLALASFFRLWQLESIPPGLYPDVAINGNDAFNALKTGEFKLFYPENNGREGLFINLIALSFAVFGVSVWSIKFVAALIGILTIPGLYLLIKEILEDKKQAETVALLSSFFLAVSFWHTNFSRIGFRAILVPLIMVFSFYFLIKGFKSKKIWQLATAGLIFGLGLHSYPSYRFTVLLLPFVLYPFWLSFKKEGLQKKYFRLSAYFLLAAFIIGLPIAFYFLGHLNDFTGRASSVFVFNSENPLKELVKSFILHLGMFNVYGDPNWRHNFAPRPMLFWPSGAVFLIGIVFSFKKAIKGVREKQYQNFNSSCFFLSWFFIMLLPGILTNEGLPHGLRVIGTIPAVYFFAGLGARELYRFFQENTRCKQMLLITSILFILAVACANYQKYFIAWANNSETYNAFSSNYIEMGKYLNSLPDKVKKYVVVNQAGVPVPWPDGIPMPAQTLIFMENKEYGRPRAIYLKTENFDQIKPEGEKTVIILMNYDSNVFVNLKTKFPQGALIQEKGIWLFAIE